MHMCLCGKIQDMFHTYFIYMNVKISSASRKEKDVHDPESAWAYPSVTLTSKLRCRFPYINATHDAAGTLGSHPSSVKAAYQCLEELYLPSEVYCHIRQRKEFLKVKLAKFHFCVHGLYFFGQVTGQIT